MIEEVTNVALLNRPVRCALLDTLTEAAKVLRPGTPLQRVALKDQAMRALSTDLKLCGVETPLKPTGHVLITFFRVRPRLIRLIRVIRISGRSRRSSHRRGRGLKETLHRRGVDRTPERLTQTTRNRRQVLKQPNIVRTHPAVINSLRIRLIPLTSLSPKTG